MWAACPPSWGKRHHAREVGKVTPEVALIRAPSPPSGRRAPDDHQRSTPGRLEAGGREKLALAAGQPPILRVPGLVRSLAAGGVVVEPGGVHVDVGERVQPDDRHVLLDLLLDLAEERLALGLIDHGYLLVDELVDRGVVVEHEVAATGLRDLLAVVQQAIVRVGARAGSELGDVELAVALGAIGGRWEEDRAEEVAGWVVVHLQLDADGLPGVLSERLGVLAVLAAGGGRDAQAEPLAVLDTDAVGARRPTGLVEQGLGRVHAAIVERLLVWAVGAVALGVNQGLIMGGGAHGLVAGRLGKVLRRAVPE